MTDFPIMEGNARMARGAGFFRVPLLSQITDQLWTGASPTEFSNGVYFLSDEHGKPRFDRILNLYPWGRYTPPKGTMKTDVEMYDSEEIDSQLEMVAHLVAEWLGEGLNVLVHCQAGLNRSALVACRTLMLTEGMTAAEAIALMREKRSPVCLCNPTFEEHLLGLDSP